MFLGSFFFFVVPHSFDFDSNFSSERSDSKREHFRIENSNIFSTIDAPKCTRLPSRPIRFRLRLVISLFFLFSLFSLLAIDTNETPNLDEKNYYCQLSYLFARSNRARSMEDVIIIRRHTEKKWEIEKQTDVWRRGEEIWCRTEKNTHKIIKKGREKWCNEKMQ